MQRRERDSSWRCVVMHKKLWKTDIAVTKTDVRKNKSDIRIKFFTTKIIKNRIHFPERLGMESPSLRMTDFKLKLLNTLMYLMLLKLRS